MGLVALTENLILLQFEFCIDYDAEDGGKVLLNRNDVETCALLVRESICDDDLVSIKVDLDGIALDQGRYIPSEKPTYKGASVAWVGKLALNLAHQQSYWLRTPPLREPQMDAVGN